MTSVRLADLFDADAAWAVRVGGQQMAEALAHLSKRFAELRVVDCRDGQSALPNARADGQPTVLLLGAECPQLGGTVERWRATGEFTRWICLVPPAFVVPTELGYSDAHAVEELS